MDLENILPNDQSQTQRTTQCIYIKCPGGKALETEWIGGCQDLGWQEWELLLKGCGFSFWDDENVLELEEMTVVHIVNVINVAN